MKSTLVPSELAERAAAFVLLALVLPFLFWAALLISTTSGGPVVLTDSVITADGRLAQSLRFRTTGAGTRAFPVVGRFLRRWNIDELPALWSVARGDIGLRDALAWWKLPR